MKIDFLDKHVLFACSVLLLCLLYFYSLNYSFSNAINVNFNELRELRSGTLVKFTGNVNVGNRTTVCLNYCVFLNDYTGDSGLATVIGVVDNRNYTTVKVLKSYS